MRRKSKIVTRKKRPYGAVIVHLHRGFVALRESGDLLHDPVFQNAKLTGLEIIDVVALVIGDREAQDDKIDFRAEDRVLGFLA